MLLVGSWVHFLASSIFSLSRTAMSVRDASQNAKAIFNIGMIPTISASKRFMPFRFAMNPMSMRNGSVKIASGTSLRIIGKSGVSAFIGICATMARGLILRVQIHEQDKVSAIRLILFCHAPTVFFFKSLSRAQAAFTSPCSCFRIAR